jgi:hypothetical protein
MCALSGFVWHSKIEVFLPNSDKPLQMTTLVNFAFPPKNVGNQSISRGITHCQRLSTRHIPPSLVPEVTELSEGKYEPCIQVIAFLTVLRKRFYESWWLWNMV